VPICPSCRSEYEEGFRRCADCDVELVGSVAEIPPEPEAPAEAPEEEFEGEIRFLAESRGLGEAIREQLLASRIPCYLYDRAEELEGRELAVFAVPGPWGERVMDLLRWPYEEVEGPRGAFRLYVEGLQGTGELGEGASALLALSDDAILARGAPAHADLAEAVCLGSPAQAARAVGLLHRSGGPGQAMLATILFEGARRKQTPFVTSFLFLLKPYTLDLPQEGLGALLADRDPEVRCLGVEIAGRLLGREGGESLVRMLGDEDVDVREAAIESLFRLFGDDFGFDPAGSAEARAAAIEQWHRRIASL